MTQSLLVRNGTNSATQKCGRPKNDLLPLALVATPNLIEAGILSGLGEISSVAEMEEAAKRIVQMGAKHVVVKGDIA